MISYLSNLSLCSILFAPVNESTFKIGQNFSISDCQLKINEVDAIIKEGFAFGLFFLRYCKNVIVCKVFPSPISSARQPPSLFSSKNTSRSEERRVGKEC